MPCTGRVGNRTAKKVQMYEETQRIRSGYEERGEMEKSSKRKEHEGEWGKEADEDDDDDEEEEEEEEKRKGGVPI